MDPEHHRRLDAIRNMGMRARNFQYNQKYDVINLSEFCRGDLFDIANATLDSIITGKLVSVCTLGVDPENNLRARWVSTNPKLPANEWAVEILRGMDVAQNGVSFDINTATLRTRGDDQMLTEIERRTRAILRSIYHPELE